MLGGIKVEHIYDNEYLYNTMTPVLATSTQCP
jgi:hypothetical protein